VFRRHKGNATVTMTNIMPMHKFQHPSPSFVTGRWVIIGDMTVICDAMLYLKTNTLSQSYRASFCMKW
jgi:hypothetical protein